MHKDGLASPRGEFATNAGERVAAGKLLRKSVPRTSHAAFDPSARTFDPLTLLAANTERRLQYLVPLLNERLSDTPFTFFRGAAIVMAADLAVTPTIGVRVQACGDAHCLNFGGFASPERNLLFDVNDFDETLPAWWEWDLKRLVTSIVIAGQDNGLKKRSVRQAARATVRAYRARMFELAALPALDVWYTRRSKDDRGTQTPLEDRRPSSDRLDSRDGRETHRRLRTRAALRG
jgi:hypothetical protein